ncbi:MAG TPA: DUF4910 domain-containing protein [Deltaproteobacteria bacterium]|nr:DUF4910 domain-containing protein [Deltaproteobacteria bacterium]
MEALIEALYPICRSITGDGLRETLGIIAERIPLERHEVATGTPVLDWTVPPEWNIRDAWIKDASGQRIVDYKASNLHVVNYSRPVPPQRLALAELDAHLHSLPEHPDWIPYRTAYYEESWGFCLPHAQRIRLEPGEYEVCIDSTLEAGALSYGELLIAGESEKEVLVSTHVCHPSLCNDNLSGIAVATWLAAELAKRKPGLSYRFLFIPGTIGAITWLERNRHRLDRIAHGLTLVCLGNDEPLRYKRTLSGHAEIDRVMEFVLRNSEGDFEIRDFHPYGYDERQYNSPGFRLPVGSLMRGVHGEFPEYHSSADNLDFVHIPLLEEAADRLLEVFAILETNGRYRNRAPFGEPQLGRRGLYRGMGGEADPRSLSQAMLWILQFSDGTNDLLSIAERSGLPWAILRNAAERLEEHDLLERCGSPGQRERGGACAS